MIRHRPLAESYFWGILSVCVCYDILVTRGGFMATQGFCPFSWSMGLNLACEGRRKKEQRRSAKMKWRLSDVAAAWRP